MTTLDALAEQLGITSDVQNADPDEVTELLRALHGWVLGGGYVPEGAVAACTRMADRGHGYGQTVAEACQDAAEREAREGKEVAPTPTRPSGTNERHDQ